MAPILINIILIIIISIILILLLISILSILINNTINKPKGCNLIKKETVRRCFNVNFIKFLGKTFYIELFIWTIAFG